MTSHHPQEFPVLQKHLGSEDQDEFEDAEDDRGRPGYSKPGSRGRNGASWRSRSPHSAAISQGRTTSAPDGPFPFRGVPPAPPRCPSSERVPRFVYALDEDAAPGAKSGGSVCSRTASSGSESAFSPRLRGAGRGSKSPERAPAQGPRAGPQSSARVLSPRGGGSARGSASPEDSASARPRAASAEMGARGENGRRLQGTLEKRGYWNPAWKTR
jgi:hypothetical protein